MTELKGPLGEAIAALHEAAEMANDEDILVKHIHGLWESVELLASALYERDHTIARGVNRAEIQAQREAMAVAAAKTKWDNK